MRHVGRLRVFPRVSLEIPLCPSYTYRGEELSHLQGMRTEL